MLLASATNRLLGNWRLSDSKSLTIAFIGQFVSAMKNILSKSEAAIVRLGERGAAANAATPPEGSCSVALGQKKGAAFRVAAPSS
jgi:hypothetical protein